MKSAVAFIILLSLPLITYAGPAKCWKEVKKAAIAKHTLDYQFEKIVRVTHDYNFSDNGKDVQRYLVAIERTHSVALYEIEAYIPDCKILDIQNID